MSQVAPAYGSVAGPVQQALQESAYRIKGRVGIEPRWLEAFVRLELGRHADILSMHTASLDAVVSRAIAAIDAVPEAECELIAREAGL